MPKKKKDEFEGMGALGKGVEGEAPGANADDPAADAAGEGAMPEEGRPEAEAEGKPEESGEGEEPAPTKKKRPKEDADFDSLKEELEKEREKSKSLAEIIEKVSGAPEASEPGGPADAGADFDSRVKGLEGRINGQVQSQMKDVRNAIAAMGAKLEEVSKAEKPEKASSKLKDMVDSVQAETSKKIADLHEEISKMLDRIEQPKKEEEVAKGLAVFGGRVDMKGDILEIRSSVKDLEKGMHELRDETDTRITRIREQIKILERLPTFEEKLEGLIERMGPANIEKLKKFVFSADEIIGEVIPNEVEKKLTKDLTPVFNDMRGVRSDVEKLGENIKSIFNDINYFKGEIKSLYKLGDYVSELQAGKEKLDDKIKEKEANLIALVGRLEGVLRKKADMINDRIEKFDKSFTAKIEAKTKEFFDDFTESKLLEIEDRTEKNLAVSRAKVNDMLSKFVQFQNVVSPTLSLMKEELEKTNARIEKVKASQADLQEEMESGAKGMFADIAVPQIKAISGDVARFSKAISDRLEDFEAEFVQFQNVVNPTLTMLKNDLGKTDARIEKLRGKHDDLKGDVNELAEMRKSIGSLAEWTKSVEARQKESDKRTLVLASRLDAALKEFDVLVRQTLSEKKKIEEENRRQRDRINILLKELKSA